MKSLSTKIQESKIKLEDKVQMLFSSSELKSFTIYVVCEDSDVQQQLWRINKAIRHIFNKVPWICTPIANMFFD